MSQAWQPIDLPFICERLIGFSVPQGDSILVASVDDMHLLRLGPPATVETDASCGEHYYQSQRPGVCRYKGRDWEILGLYPGRPLLTSPQGEWLEFDEEGCTISVFIGTEEVWSTEFKNFSGDWAAATFSPDGNLIVLGCPYDFDLRVWRRDAAPGG